MSQGFLSLSVELAMPLYEYHCTTCEQDCEVLIRGSELPVCTHCQESSPAKLQKKFSVPAGHVAGSMSLPVCQPQPRAAGCGLPQCGSGGCGM
jgi:putative FmdB family regulatory protein